MKKTFLQSTKELMSFITQSPTAFQAAEVCSNILEKEGFQKIGVPSFPTLTAGKYFLPINGSAVIAVQVPENPEASCLISATHSDSPTFKIKPNAENVTAAGFTKLNVEPYGGMIMSSWMDRPLSVAGRIMIEDHGTITSQNVCLDRDLVIIPSLCIHFNRSVNEGYKYNPAVDLQPLYSEKDGETLLSLLTKESAVKEDQIVASDLYLYNRTPATLLGPDQEFFASPRIDNLQCTYATLHGFLHSEATQAIKIWCLFDNEEVGSDTKQGAASTTLLRLVKKLAEDNDLVMEELMSSTFAVSADNGHAIHPNHPEYSDTQNAPVMNGGVVIKYNASQKYATDAVADALFRSICKKANVPVQVLSNRSDIRGGSTLGSILDTLLPVTTVDIGLAQLAMHSSYETAGVKDTYYLEKAMKTFFSSSLHRTADNRWVLK